MARSRPRRPYGRRIDKAAAAFLLSLFLAGVQGPATAVADSIALQLEVFINGQPVGLIAAFVQLPDGSLASTRQELEEVGIEAGDSGPPDQYLTLSAMVGVSYRYNEELQSVEIDVPESLRIAKSYNAAKADRMIPAISGTGVVINYTAFAEASSNFQHLVNEVNGGSLSLDAHAFSPYGTLNQSGIIGTTTFKEATVLRLDTTWSYSDPERILDYAAGDIISGGLAWTRPIRMGGAQLQRDFSIRPDLVTMPLPSVSGSAMVPSTIDVYVNNVKTYSQDVGAGPYLIENLPAISGNGMARVVVSEANGSEKASELPFYASADLLRPGLFDFSVEIGVARRSYAEKSFDYDDQPAGLFSGRYGLSDRITLEAHAEAGSGLINGGAGGVLLGGSLGLMTVAGAASVYKDDAGAMIYVAWEGGYGDLTLHVSTRHTLGPYRDLAALTDKGEADEEGFEGFEIPEALDELTIGYGFPDWKASLGAGLIHIDWGDGDRSVIANGGYSQTFDNGWALFANGFYDFGDNRNLGAFVGLSVPLGASISSYAGVIADRHGLSASAEATRTLGSEPGSVGWRIADTEGATRSTTAVVSYRAPDALVTGTLYQQGDGIIGNVSADGAVVVADGGVFFGQHVDDAFAVVDAGVAGVPVTIENRPAGVTNGSGKLLVTGLNAYQKNKLAIDTTSLPVNAGVSDTEAILIPGSRSGSVVKFGIEKSTASAVVVFTRADGSFVPVSAPGTLNGAEESFMVGYDGEAFVAGLASMNTVNIATATGACMAAFPYVPDGENQVRIGPVVCQ